MNNLELKKILQMQYIQLFQYYVVLSSRYSMILPAPETDFIFFFLYIVYLKEISMVVIVEVLSTSNFLLLEISDSL